MARLVTNETPAQMRARIDRTYAANVASNEASNAARLARLARLAAPVLAVAA